MKKHTEQRRDAFLNKTPEHIEVLRPDPLGFVVMGFAIFIAILILDLLFFKLLKFLSTIGIESGIQSESMFFPLFLVGMAIGLWRLFSYRIELTDEELILYQFLRKRTLKWDEIRSFKDRAKLTHWESRTHPPSAIYIFLKSKKGYETYINAKLFSKDDLDLILKDRS